jgi:hypothetical protein
MQVAYRTQDYLSTSKGQQSVHRKQPSTLTSNHIHTGSFVQGSPSNVLHSILQDVLRKIIGSFRRFTVLNVMILVPSKLLRHLK